MNHEEMAALLYGDAIEHKDIGTVWVVRKNKDRYGNVNGLTVVDTNSTAHKWNFVNDDKIDVNDSFVAVTNGMPNADEFRHTGNNTTYPDLYLITHFE